MPTNLTVYGSSLAGTVSAACFAERGCVVAVVDADSHRADAINAGRSPISEPGLEALIAKNVSAGRLRAVGELDDEASAAGLSLVCVETPSDAQGDQILTALSRALEQIGRAIASQDARHSVVVRSTLRPGTTEGLVIPLLESNSGKAQGVGFDVCYNPEFLRQGTALADFWEPRRTIVGSADAEAAAEVLKLYDGLPGDKERTSTAEAEMVKFVENAWHGLKAMFANEIGRISEAHGIDSAAVMEVFVQDSVLNLSPAYLRPGFAFGGPCLPKDLRALLQRAGERSIDTPLLSSIIPSNQRHIDRALRVIDQRGCRNIGLVGLAFKPGTDDLRESPLVTLAERILAKGYRLCVYDPNVRLKSLVGANREAALTRLPSLETILVEKLQRFLETSELIVLGHRNGYVNDILPRIGPDQQVLDLARPERGAWQAG